MKLSGRNRIAIMGFAALVSMITGGCALADRMSGVSDAKALQEIGEPAEATIVKIWDTGMTVNDDPVVGFLLEVRPSGKPGYQAETKLRISRVDVPRVQPGMVVMVRIDPKDPKHVALDIYDYGEKKKIAACIGFSQCPGKKL
jgi:hypothetical protein